MNPNIENKNKQTSHPKDFAKKRYLADLQILAPLKQEKAQQYGLLVFTLITLSFFGLFAINPTIATIVELRKKLADSELVNTKLEQKIAAMSSLQEQYSEIEPELPIVYSAIPENPDLAMLFGQIQEIAKQNDVAIDDMNSFPIILKFDPKTQPATIANRDSVGFSIQTTGTYDNLQQFLEELTDFNRIVTITQVSVTRENAQGEKSRQMTIEGKAYYQHGV